MFFYQTGKNRGEVKQAILNQNVIDINWFIPEPNYEEEGLISGLFLNERTIVLIKN